MLKRKRSDGRAPNKGPNGSSNNYGSAPPPSTITPQPEKAVAAFEASYADVLRALKKARGFERQRLARRILEEKKQANGKKGKGKASRAKAVKADTTTPGESDERLQRLEREVEVLRTLDYEVTARVHLANAMTRTRDLPDAPGPLGAHLQLASEVLSNRTKAYRTDDIHNVTSALYNRPFVRDAVAKAVRGMCQLVGVAPPDKKAGRQRKGKDDTEEDAVAKETLQNTKANTGKPIDPPSDDDNDEEDEDEEEEDNAVYNEDDDEAIERELAKYDSMLGGSGGEDSESEADNDNSDDDSDEGLDDDAVVAKLRAKYNAAVAKGLWRDDGDEISDAESGSDEDEEEFAGFSPGESDEEVEGEDEEEEDDDSSSDEDLRPQKRVATAASSGATFLPSLMGGYISDGDGSDDGRRATIADDEAAAERMLGGPRKNRRGQRARQAIWEQKYKLLAKHVLEGEKKEKSDGGKTNKNGKAGKQREGGWDAKRGAVDANDAPRWMRRKMGITGRVGPVGGGGSGKGAPAAAAAAARAPAKKENTNANAQVSGTLHPSWEAARKAKDKAQTAAFEGKKIVFD